MSLSHVNWKNNAKSQFSKRNCIGEQEGAWPVYAQVLHLMWDGFQCAPLPSSADSDHYYEPAPALFFLVSARTKVYMDIDIE
jgi:hypothetical protein